MRTGKYISIMKMREVLPSLRIIAAHYGLRLNRPTEFKAATTILIKQAPKN